MTGFVVQGWCPGALKPMMSGDGLVVRIRPRMARLTVAQARGVAAAALTHGSGLIDLTARANLQLRGIRPAAHLALLDDLTTLDLLDANAEVERHRNLTVSPYWTGEGWEPLAHAISTLLTSHAFSCLPNKFGVTLDLTQPMVLQDVASDIRVEWHQNGWLIRPDGFATGAVVQGVNEATDALRRLLKWFLARGVTDGRGRMAALAGQHLPQGFDRPMTPALHKPAPGPHPAGYLVGLEFGQMRAETLAALANSPLRITPWRMILIEGAASAPNLPGLITAADDPRLKVTACTGAPGCPQALQPTRDLARRLAPQVPPGQHLHVSGCAKGCAHPAAADITLTATAQGYTLIRNGRAADPGTPALTNSFKAL